MHNVIPARKIVAMSIYIFSDYSNSGNVETMRDLCDNLVIK